MELLPSLYATSNNANTTFYTPKLNPNQLLNTELDN